MTREAQTVGEAPVPLLARGWEIHRPEPGLPPIPVGCVGATWCSGELYVLAVRHSCCKAGDRVLVGITRRGAAVTFADLARVQSDFSIPSEAPVKSEGWCARVEFHVPLERATWR